MEHRDEFVEAWQSTSLNPARAVRVAFENDCLIVALDDGRTIAVFLEWFPALTDATDEQQSKWKLVGGGVGIHWEDLDEDLSIAGLLNPADRVSERSN